MSNMSPLDQAKASDALDLVSTGCATLDMRDCHSEMWGVNELSLKLESTQHRVEWVFNNTKAEVNWDPESNTESTTLMKNGGEQEGWDDGFLVTKLDNVMGIRMGQTVDACHIKFGMTAKAEDTNLFQSGFYVGLYPEHCVMRGAKGAVPQKMGRYDLNERFVAQIKNGGVTVTRFGEENPFDVIGDCTEEGTSMYGMIHIHERDAMGQLEDVMGIAMVTSIDLNGNMLADVGMERLAEALEMPFTKVKNLDLGLNRIRDIGAMRIATVLEKSFCRIESLVLSHNEIGDEGLTRLAEVLGKDGSRVSKLWLEGNHIGDEGVTALAETLEKESNQLTLLELAWNKIEDEGAQRLFQAISKPECKIEHFTIDHNKFIEKKTKKMLAMIMSKVPKLVDMT